MNKSYKSETKKGLIGLGAMVVLGAVVIGAANPVYQSLSKIGRKKGTESIYQPGTYEASAKGFAGDVKVVLTVTDKDIETLNVTGEQETPEFGGKAIAELPLLMLKEQTAEVDAVAGATITSDAIKKAVNLALAEARGEEIPEETTVAETETESAEKVTYAPGTYEGSAKGFGGEVKAEVVVTEAGIESIKVTGDSETPEIGGKAMEELPAAMVEKQSIEVDAIAGATVTSDAVKEAVKTALEAAKQ